MDVSFRLAEYSDLRNIKDVARTHPITAKAIGHISYCNKTRFEKQEVLVGLLDDKVVCFAYLKFRTRRSELEFDLLGVHSDVRRLGIGSAMMAFVRNGYIFPIYVLNVRKENEGALLFYQELGFQKVAECRNGTSWRMSTARMVL